MQLPDDSIGITDILNYRECPRRFSFGMRRHVGVGQQNEGDANPEAARFGAVWSRGYGSAIHHAISEVDEGASDEDAVQSAFNEYGRFLEPADWQGLLDDLGVYHARDIPNARIIAAEEDLRVPLMTYKGRVIYFRFKLDKLYERLDAPGLWVHIDYKSSRHAKSAKEVREDLQLWAYNWAIHEYYDGEFRDLLQVYDQLKYGQEDTRKTDAAREKIRQWLIAQVTAIIEDDDVQDDGLLPFQQNEWCEWCPVMESCGVIEKLTDYALVEIAALSPVVKEGRKKVTKLDQAPIEEYIARFAQAKQAAGVLKRFVEALTGVMKEMPAERRGSLGYELVQRGSTKFDADSKRELHEKLRRDLGNDAGDELFYALVGLTKTSIEEKLEPGLAEFALSLGYEGQGSPVLKKVA